MTPPRARNDRDEEEKEESENSELRLGAAERCERKGHGIENGVKCDAVELCIRARREVLRCEQRRRNGMARD